jgi:aminocarboxymuconate-semialdehyde decarboxylase
VEGNGYLSNVIGNPLRNYRALAPDLRGHARPIPGLKIIAAHAGGFHRRIRALGPGCGARPDQSGGTHGPIKRRPSEYLRQLYYDTMVFSPEGVRHLVAEVGASQLMVGTDYPFPWTRTAVDLILETPGLSDDDRVAMLGGTAARLLGIQS